MRIRIADVELSLDEAMNVLAQYRNRLGTVRYYDLGGEEGAVPSDGVLLSDLGRMVFLDSDLTGQNAADLMSAGRDAPWDEVPLSARLGEADPEKDGGLYDAALRLHKHFDKLPEIGLTKSSKLLHLKRPFLYPILDSLVRAHYQEAAKRVAEKSVRLKGQRVAFWAAIREDLLHGGDALSRLKERLNNESSGGVGLLSLLPELRLIDILAWLLKKSGK